MLENAVHPIDDLRAVKISANMETVKSGEELTYDKYRSLLLSAAADYDEKYTPKKTKRTVYTHDIIGDDDPTGLDDYDDYDIDCPVSVLQANVAEQDNTRTTTGRVRMPRE